MHAPKSNGRNKQNPESFTGVLNSQLHAMVLKKTL